MLGQLKVKIDGQLKNVVFEKYNNLSSLSEETKQFLSTQIHSILVDCWGKFHDEFIEKHVLGGDRLIVARVDRDYVGFCVLSFKRICEVDVHYVEFLAIKRAFQKLGVGPRLFYLITRDDIRKNLFNLVYKPIEIMFITSNIIALTHIARFASFSYPNPRLADSNGRVFPADDLTWAMAQELIRSSDKPGRKLNREGLVLHDSYADTPWLVYGPDNAPQINDPKTIEFVKKYLGYHGKEDKELVVRAHITLRSILKYFYHRIFKP